jgi:serine/threonine protein kinase
MIAALLAYCRKMPLAPGSPYEIVDLIGPGGMGEVYSAIDPPGARGGDQSAAGGGRHVESLERFRREARAIAAPSHPNIVAILDIGSHAADATWFAEEAALLEHDLGGTPRAFASVLPIRTGCGSSRSGSSGRRSKRGLYSSAGKAHFCRPHVQSSRKP